MKHLQKFPMINESRSQELSEEKFKEILESKCKNWNLDNTQLYRGVKNKTPFSYINPGKYQREHVSIDNDDINIYSIIMKNSKQWSKFPDRDNSIIVGTDLEIITDYAQWSDDDKTMLYYIVIPFDNTEWGMTPKNDLWFSYDRDELGTSQLQEFNNIITSTLTKLSKQNHIKINNLADLENILNTIDWSDKKFISTEIYKLNDVLTEDSEYDDIKYDGSIINITLNNFIDCNNSKDGLNNILSSLNTNAFDLQKYGSNGLILNSKSVECWSEGECIMIRRDYFEKMFGK